MVICQDAALLTVDSCPEASKVSYALSPTFDPKTRRYVNLSNAADTGEISAGRITTLVGNLFITQNILASSSDALRTNAPAFSIALQDTSAWPAVSARGASNFDASTDGAQVLAFRRGLFHSVLNDGVALRTATVAYSVEDDGASIANDVCWWGDALLAPHLFRLAGLKAVRAVVRFGDIVPDRRDRFVLSEQARAQVQQMYVELRADACSAVVETQEAELAEAL